VNSQDGRPATTHPFIIMVEARMLQPNEEFSTFVAARKHLCGVVARGFGIARLHRDATGIAHVVN
jgi:hypothetical protein